MVATTPIYDDVDLRETLAEIAAEVETKEPEWQAPGFNPREEIREIGRTITHTLEYYVPDANVLAIVVGVPLLVYSALQRRIHN